MKFARASVVLAASLLYLAYVFQLSDTGFWNAGLNYWLDPYFINVLLEHWYNSLWRAADPSSPPMFFPVQKTLGYSHGLVLYAPFYVPLRLFLHPFQAHNWAVFVALEVGILCLYVLLRKLGLSFTGSLALSALFFSSQNVINEQTSAWTQRASVFLIPPILLMLLVSARMHIGRPRLILASVAGFLSTLMYVQDFYTAHLALLFAVVFAAAAASVESRVSDVSERISTFWKAQTRASQVALVTAAVATAWTGYVWMFGGGQVTVWDVRLRSRDWRRPALIAVVALIAFLGLSRAIRAATRFAKTNPWCVAVTLGAVAGAIVFLWIYLGAYLEHRAFPEDHLVSQLLPRYPSRWSSPLDFVRDLNNGYHTLRSFKLVVVLGVLAWIPWFGIDRKVRIYCLWFLAISFVVLLIPLRFPELSVWRVFFERLPGFGVIRDPKRIIYLYELAVVLVTAVFLTRLPAKSVSRVFITLLVLFLLVTERNPYVFRYHRPIDVYERWVAAPIDIDPSCRSFYIKGASDEYMSRSDHMWSYSVDSLFVALNHGIPTLNGYSAWFPDGWGLLNPQEAGYDEEVQRWIDKHKLRRVCEFDIDARTLKRRN